MLNAHSYDYTPQLQKLMQLRGISTFKQLSQKAAISAKQVMRLRRGQVSQMRLETLDKLSQVLQVSIADLMTMFMTDREDNPEVPKAAAELQTKPQENALTTPLEEPTASESAIHREYQRLQTQLIQQRDEIWQEFQQSSLQTLEPWLLQWSAAAYAAQQNPQAPAIKLVPLVRPVEQLLQQWGIEAIAAVGSELPYDPQQHQLMSGTAEPGDLVRVRYTGYRQGDRLLYRAKVSPA